MSLNVTGYGNFPIAKTYSAQAKSGIFSGKSKEVFANEGEILMDLYEKYTKTAGGVKEINGQRVHVTGSLDLSSNKGAREAVIAIQHRLGELGLLA